MGDVAMLAHALRALKRGLSRPAGSRYATRPAVPGLFHRASIVGFLDVDVKGAHHSLRGMWRLAAEARRLGADAVADVHGVLRSVTFRTALRLRGVPVAAIGKGRDEKERVYPQRRPGCQARQAYRRPLLRRVPEAGVRVRRPRSRPCGASRPSPMGEKTGYLDRLLAPFSAQQGKTYPRAARPARRCACLAGRYDRVFIHSGGGCRGGVRAGDGARVTPMSRRCSDGSGWTANQT